MNARNLIFGLCGPLVFYMNMSSHQPPESFFEGNGINYEKRVNGTDSKVFLVNGLTWYNRLVLEQSFVKPVALKVFSHKSSESKRIVEIFHALADEFKDRVACVALDLFAEKNQSNQNYQIIMSLMSRIKLANLDLPTFIFFDQGRMLLPVSQGFYSKENLVALVNKHFFDKK